MIHPRLSLGSFLDAGLRNISGALSPEGWVDALNMTIQVNVTFRNDNYLAVTIEKGVAQGFSSHVRARRTRLLSTPHRRAGRALILAGFISGA